MCWKPIRRVQVGREPITFTQIVGADGESGEDRRVVGPGGNIAAGAIAAFPPIWSEIMIKVYNDGRTEASVLRHSLFPSLTFYTAPVNASGVPNEKGTYSYTPW